AAIQAGRTQPPLALTHATAPGELSAWRPARARGQWLNQYSVLLDNRNQDGRPGYWLATPLLLDPASRGAVLVLRGWLPRAQPGQPGPPPPAAPPRQQSGRGARPPRAPRLSEVWSFGGAAQGQVPAAQP